MNADQKPNLHHRRSIRLKSYDYSSEGSYYITIVTHNRELLFGNLQDGVMAFSNEGQIVWDVWNTLPNRYPQIELDCAIVMPNHFHGIINIVEQYPPVGIINDPQPPVGVIHELPLRDHELPLRDHELPLRDHELPQPDHDLPLPNDRSSRRRMLLPLVVGYFKMNTAKRINILHNTQGLPIWQRNYYEHIIDTDKEYNQIAEYILSNPLYWQTDSENNC
ncbi:MAG: transposase [Anaerolineae bacterium]|nr:transposase [Anaerolineae bacterium]